MEVVQGARVQAGELSEDRTAVLLRSAFYKLTSPRIPPTFYFVYRTPVVVRTSSFFGWYNVWAIPRPYRHVPLCSSVSHPSEE